MEPPFSNSKRKDPPTRASSICTVIDMPLGLNQDSSASGSIQARNTRRREAVNDRRNTRVALLCGTGGIIRVLLLFRCCQQVGIQRVELCLPKVPIMFKPGSGLSHG